MHFFCNYAFFVCFDRIFKKFQRCKFVINRFFLSESFFLNMWTPVKGFDIFYWMWNQQIFMKLLSFRMEKMGNRYPASFYDQLLAGPTIRSVEENFKAAEILAPLWPRYQTWKRKKAKARRRNLAVWLLVLAGVVLSLRLFPGVQWWIFAHLRIAVTVRLSIFLLIFNDVWLNIDFLGVAEMVRRPVVE